MENGPIVVVGIGNILLGDEGIGVHLIRLLQKEFVHPAVSYYDGGTKGLTLLPFLEEASHLLILDAVRAEGASGTIVEMSDHELMGNSLLKFSAHDIALPDLIALLRFKRGPSIHIRFLGVVPGSFDFSTDLSPEVGELLVRLAAASEEDSMRMDSTIGKRVAAQYRTSKQWERSVCLGIPGKVLEIERDDSLGLSRGRVQFGGIEKEVNLIYTPAVQVGDYVVVHVGFAISKLDEDEAKEVFSYLEQMEEN